MEEGKFVLWAQVRTGTPQMKVDKEGVLRPNAWPEGGSLVYLGDVTQAVLSSLGPHSPPEFIERPGFDEQRWTISVQSNELKILIRSESYWGFGLFARCYLNKIEIIGTRNDTARIAFDIIASLGRDPWATTFPFAFRRKTELSINDHQENWTELINAGKYELAENIELIADQYRKLIGKVDKIGKEHLIGVDENITTARQALHDRNAPAVSRALSRAERSLILANPKTRSNLEEQMNESDDEEIPFVDLTESE
ncbi:MAG: hypothetical protein CMB17_06865 [Euryarchaeota archaeon]|nr:hypothetical protein [Euryarchaeota archaeon]|tara:strand:+ start:3706 stop:4467 length:762 start_codon:yes stop_codon:yes gene_type:complete